DALGGVVLSKDVVRAALFPAPVLDYSAEQDHIAMSAVYQAAEYILCLTPRPVFVDGRTFTKPGQIEEASALAAELYMPLRFSESRRFSGDSSSLRKAGDAAHPDPLKRVTTNSNPEVPHAPFRCRRARADDRRSVHRRRQLAALARPERQRLRGTHRRPAR